eukprot:TRINITY_DN637_c0_g1_i2.p1 TRINITY_DN637_c0_g1~~TRINITY_DN637_c0_g1_i2.p1  ORF type:complete len:281 (+),score=16.91 TRINITY_DN637_c0_g1_i2:101-844(+)
MCIRDSSDPLYIETVQDNCFTEIQRENLVVWILQFFPQLEEITSQALKVSQRTKELSIIYLNSYLSKKKCSIEQFESLGITVIFLSLKIEERFPFTLQQLSSLVKDKTIDTAELQKIELEILESLDWQLNIQTPGEYAREFIQYLFEEEDQLKLLDYVDDFMDICIANYKFLQFKSSEIALTCIVLIIEQIQTEIQYQAVFIEKVFNILPIEPSSIEQCFQIFVGFAKQIDDLENDRSIMDEEVVIY